MDTIAKDHIIAPPSAVSRRMARTRGRDNPFEREVRSRLHALGFRFRIHHPLPGMPRRTADIAFPGRRLAIFLDGCFWHGCPVHATHPRTNAGFWQAKLRANRDRDADTDARLRAAGWTVLRYWEHEGPVTIVAAIAGARVALGWQKGLRAREPPHRSPPPVV